MARREPRERRPPQLKVGNTEVLAQAISARLDCDMHRIEPADPYLADYDETVERNIDEQDTDARPEIANPSRRSTTTTRSCSPARSRTSARR
jgi:hypothetical protein